MQASVTQSVQTSGWVDQKSCGTPGTVENRPRRTKDAICAMGHDGRMSAPAARKCIGTSQSASRRYRSGRWIHSVNDAPRAAWTSGTQSISTTGSVA